MEIKLKTLATGNEENYMVYTKISDGLGNQMFMYACGYAISRRLHTELVLDATPLDTNQKRKFELSKFNIECNRIISANRFRYKGIKVIFRKLWNGIVFNHMNQYKESTPYCYESRIKSIDNNTYISGYWQSEKYFAEYREDLLRMFTPKKERDISVKRICDEMQRCNSVAIHIRRGDYLQVGCQIDMKYYETAIKMMKSLIPDGIIVLYVFSDDIEFCKGYFSEIEKSHTGTIEFRYPNYKSEDCTLDDLILMSNCHHIIMANSSYSWWAAWLNKNENKIVICPDVDIWKGDFYPDKWKKIEIK